MKQTLESKVNTRQKAFAEAQKRRRRSADWLKTFMAPGHPKPATKEELFAWARDNLGSSRASFDAGCIMAIEETGRHDWYEPGPSKNSKSH